MRVEPGIEGLLRDSIHLVRGRTVGLVSNQGGVDATGISDVERLLDTGIRLVALMSPEHGFRGSAAGGQVVASTRDSATGLPIYSLYGAQRGATDSMLAGMEVILVDLPDVGARYYTYLSTTIEVMRSAARLGRTVIILDRPNPIGGAVQGNVLDPAHRSFVGPLAMPMRHGMTLGELAHLANRELSLEADLRVVPAAGWSRRLTLAATGLPFIPPSPNLRDLESLFHYPGLCLFEGTALSVGRGTSAPFRQVGAPWLDVARVLALLDAARLPGVRFEEVTFTPIGPDDGKFPGVPLRGIRLGLTDASRYDPTITAVTLLAAVARVHPDSIGFRASGFDRLAGGPALREAILASREPFAIGRDWVAARETWKRYRKPVLLYR
ncbi:MAG TPA: DUF1343 domain-containing protein [Gemmatimonadales bacterium]|nr:DUF1343 domain-containing protein [Gemmatimonadales bacterium]